MKNNPEAEFDQLVRAIRTRITFDEHDPVQLACLLDAMRGFLDNDLNAVIRSPSGQRFAHYSQRVEHLPIEDKEVAQLLRDCGVILKGEVCYIRFDRRKPRLQALEQRVLAAVGLEVDDDPLAKGWRPPYWDDPAFIAALNMPCIDYLGQAELVGWGNYPFAHMMHDQYGSEEPIHYMGGCMRFLREQCSASGRLPRVRAMLQRCNRRGLWPTALVPPEWQAPDGVPGSWKRELRRIKAKRAG